MKESESPMDAFVRRLWLLWTAVTVLVLSSGALCYGVAGMGGFHRLVQNGPVSIVQQTFVCVGAVWLICGACALLLRNSTFRREHGLALVCAAAVTLLYVNILRERTQYGDVLDYVRAVFDLHNGRAFHDRYVYPPFLAMACQPLVGLGEKGLKAAFWMSNILSLGVFFALLNQVLITYGFGKRLSLVLVCLFMAVNVPILRTLGYVQINLHVMNLILLSVLAFPRHTVASALALALAVHLKASPLILVPAFLLTRDIKWALSFLAAAVGLAAVTYGLYGWGPFASFLHNARNIYDANGICFRENSIDSLVRSTGWLVGKDFTKAIACIKVPALLYLAWLMLQTVRQTCFSTVHERRMNLLNSLPVLLILMVVASPLVWEHHFVFLAVPFLLILRKLGNPSQWACYSFAYVLAFLMPTFDCYPWSFGRLASLVILAALTQRVCKEPDAAWFAAAQRKVGSLGEGVRI